MIEIFQWGKCTTAYLTYKAKNLDIEKAKGKHCLGRSVKSI